MPHVHQTSALCAINSLDPKHTFSQKRVCNNKQNTSRKTPKASINRCSNRIDTMDVDTRDGWTNVFFRHVVFTIQMQTDPNAVLLFAVNAKGT